MRRHRRREPSYYLSFGAVWALSWAMVIGLGYGLTALAVHLAAP